MTTIPSGKVPKATEAEYAAVAALTDQFCAEHLNDEYAVLCRKAVAALARKRPSPLKSGAARTWACAVVYAIGQTNYLDGKDSKPHMRLGDLCARFDVGASTGGNKAKLIRNLLGIGQLDPNWTLPSQLVHNPMVWMIEINGFIVDARRLKVEVQQQAVELGLIPFVVPPAGSKAAA